MAFVNPGNYTVDREEACCMAAKYIWHLNSFLLQTTECKQRRFSVLLNICSNKGENLILDFIRANIVKLATLRIKITIWSAELKNERGTLNNERGTLKKTVETKAVKTTLVNIRQKKQITNPHFWFFKSLLSKLHQSVKGTK